MSSNSVFINYRRSVSAYLAQLVWRELTDAGIDAFYDMESINAGQFDQIILNQIAARPYFMPILSPGTLERCQEPGDWVLREMQEALRLKRVIVPLVTEEFSFTDFDQYLPPELAAELRNYNAMPVPPRWFKYAITEVRDRFLKPIEIATTPTPKSDVPVINQKQAAAAAQPEVTVDQLTAQEFFDRAYKHYANGDFAGAIAGYSEAIRLNPAYGDAYNNRGIAHADQGDFEAAIADFRRAIELKISDLHLPHNNLGIIRQAQGDVDGAIAHFTEAIQLNPDYADAYYNRGIARGNKGDFDGKIADFTEAIRINPDDATAFINRGATYNQRGEMPKAAADYRRVLELQPDHLQAKAMREFIQKYG